jgi:hypothetical protein
MRPARSPEPLWIHAVAMLATLAVLSLLLRLLWQVPQERESPPETRIQLRWLSPLAAMQAVLPDRTSAQPVISQPPPVMSPEVEDLTTRTQPSVPPAASTVPPTRMSLYGSDGQAALAPDTVRNGKQQSNAERVFEHHDELATGVGERATANLFSGRRAGTRQKRSESLIYGEDIQAAEARRPPDIAFNPALHERPADLGSEATGDAYKAAPIRYEKAPDLKGEASRRIRVAIGDLERRYPRCATAQRSQWLAPALAQLDALQRVEYRYNHGADPVEAQHSLPSAADNAYDQARRALWDAERRMKMCT